MGDINGLLRATPLCVGLEPEVLALLGGGTRRAGVRAGEVVFQYGDRAATAFVVIAGRVQITATDRSGAETVLGLLGPGEVFGASFLFESDRRPTTALAAQDSDLLAIDGDTLRDAVGASRQLAFALLTGFGRQLKQAMKLHRGDRPAARIAVIRGRGTEGFADALAGGIAGYGQTVLRKQSQDGPLPAIPPAHRQLAEWVSDDLTPPPPDRLAAFDRLVWVVPPAGRGAAERAVRAAVASDPVLAHKARIVWLLDPDERAGPAGAAALGVRDFKVPARGEGKPPEAFDRAVGRVVRDLLELRRGLALSGGGAKGMAHLGVLRALDRAGLDFDALAGTSGGALAGVPYAAGYAPGYCVTNFTRDLATPWYFRWLPRGKNLFLLWCFRAGRFDAMLRPYLHDWRLDQLPVPFAALTVDLVTGREVVRDASDAVHAILESINVPGVARPIARGDQALTDGGVLNNLPTDVLVAKGAGFVVGVDVTRKTRAEFAGLTPGGRPGRRPRSMETMFRVLEVLSSATHAGRARVADLMIEPDTAAFGFADFDRTPELADIGERAAEQALPQLRDALSAFERRVLAG